MNFKVCVVGAGAIGGLIGTRLAVAGQAQVCALARGATLAALQQHGWRLDTSAGALQAATTASDEAMALGVQDLVVVAVKGQSLPALAASLAPLLGPHTRVMLAMNGVPWWFCDNQPGFAGTGLASVDPGGHIARAIPTHQVAGCVVHASCSVVEPGRVQHRQGLGLIVGHALGGQQPQVQTVVDLLAGAGFAATHSPDVRQDIWFKLLGNMTMNPVSALTGATIDRVLADPLVRAFCSAAMAEAGELGARIGCPARTDPESRHAVTVKLGAFKTSMLQDVESGRGIELDGLLTVLHEMASRLGVATPNINALLGLTRLSARVRGLYPVAEVQPPTPTSTLD